MTTSSELLISIKAALDSLSTSIGEHLALPPVEPPAPPPPPEPVPPEYFTWPSTFQFFGPVQGAGALQGNLSYSEPIFQGNALTASTKFMHIGPKTAKVNAARAVAVWAPGSTANIIEIVKFDNGPSNIERIGIMQSRGVTSPVVDAVDLKDALNEIIAAGGGKQLGFRMAGASSYVMYELRLEVEWRKDLDGFVRI